jgi:anti-sigma factor RsiW
MIDRDLPVTEDELHAYVDGELPASRHAAVEAWLTTHPEDHSRVVSWRAQMDRLRARYGGVIDEEVPARLSLARLQRGQHRWMGAAVAATVAAFAIGGLGGWFARGASAAGPNGFQLFTSEAIDAHKLYVVEVRHPVEVPGAEQAHLVQWLSKRLNRPLRAPDLEKVGLKLVGGRLLPGPTGPAAFFMYENASGQRFTLYCAHIKAPDTAMRYNAVGDAAALYWVDGDFAYVVSGEPDRERLQKVAQTAYDQMDQRAAVKNGG